MYINVNIIQYFRHQSKDPLCNVPPGTKLCDYFRKSFQPWRVTAAMNLVNLVISFILLVTANAECKQHYASRS
jgi:hypothetical protein